MMQTQTNSGAIPIWDKLLTKGKAIALQFFSSMLKDSVSKSKLKRI
ncbi:MAG: hypothetical protein IPM69_08375 [Ignavibacteria bacterium]|nr:hypothetical protein [Ignavibacteria bacterium]